MSTPQIPQDIINNIIDELHSDFETLKACAVVSHSFVLPTRRHLFRSISLDSLGGSGRLCDLLLLQPDIALSIRELDVTSWDELPDAWFTKDQSLPKILQSTRWLQQLSLCNYSGYSPEFITWGRLSLELKSALTGRCKSPTLTEIQIRGITQLPISIITNSPHWRKLGFSYTDFDEQSSHILRADLLNLQALKLYKLLKPLPECVLAGIRSSRIKLLSIGSCDLYTCTSAQKVISSAAKSIRSVIWNYAGASYREDSAAIVCLGIIPCLEYLHFGIQTWRGQEDSFFNATFVSLLRRLADQSVTKFLKELTIVIDAFSYPSWDAGVLALSEYHGWKDLDSILSLSNHNHALSKVCISVNIFDFPQPASFEQLQNRMQVQLPRLAQRGLLSTRIDSRFELNALVWSNGE